MCDLSGLENRYQYADNCDDIFLLFFSKVNFNGLGMKLVKQIFCIVNLGLC